tara:strand:+ start:5268 stop:5690 length:423 start_codon:yes stop_codon:yes gene_type:complete
MKESKSYSFYFLVLFIGFQGISGLIGGAVLVIDPTGVLVQLPTSMLDGSPFDNFLIPGIILLTILGVFPMIVLYGLTKKRLWSWFGAFTVSVALIIWIGVEILIVGYHPEPPLQLIYGLLGIIMLGLVLIPSVRRTLKFN